MSDRDSRTIGSSMEETTEYHRRYLMAVNSPVRREILRALKDGDATLDSLASATGLDSKTMGWHLGILEHGFCVEKNMKDGETVYRLTQEGRVVDFMDEK